MYTLYLMFRTLDHSVRLFPGREVFEYIHTRLYTAQVRPHLKYAQSVWSPLRKMDIDAIKNVQRRATKQIAELKNMTYKERLVELKMPTLKHRRLRGDMIDMYKVMQGKYDQKACPNIKLRKGTTRGNNKEIFKTRARTKVPPIHQSHRRCMEQPTRQHYRSRNRGNL